MNEQHDHVEVLLNRALEFKPEERAAFLAGACGHNHELREKVETLLRAAEDAQGFMEGITQLDGAALTEGPGTRIGRYKILQQIGEGGMGVVYMAEQTEPVIRKVALKIIKLGMDTRAVVARFEAERQALAMMDHPNIARVLDGGATETGRPYFVMELVQGVPISDFCDRNKLPARERLKLFLPVCQAIQSAHQKGIVHRDIKPSNVLVTLNHGEPVPMVIDFGIAKATHQTLTEKTLFTNYGAMIGTPAYMSPEQAEMSSLDVDTRADVYSLGVLLYELLTGTTPFPEKRLRSLGYGEMQRVIIEEEPERPSTRLSTLSAEEKTVVMGNRSQELAALSHLLKGDLDWVVMKCLEKDRRRRYETVNGLAKDIERHLANEPVVARPPSTAYRLQKVWRRNRLALTAGALVFLALVLGITASSWQAVVATRAKAQEKQQRLEAQLERDKARALERIAEKAKEVEASLRHDLQSQLYAAKMNLAQQAWDDNNVRRVKQLLEETQDSLDRGFEWFYWQKQTHLASKTLLGHTDDLSSAAFSPDGGRILTASSDGTARVWDGFSGRELLVLRGHLAGVHAAVFSPDGQRIATCGGSSNFHIDFTARVWDAVTGRELLVLRGHKGPVQSLSFAPDGRYVATGSWDGTAKLWDAASGSELITINRNHGGISAVAFSPDGKQLASANEDSTITVYNVQTGQERLTLKGHSGTVFSVAYSPDGHRIVSGGADLSAKVWDAASGRELFSMLGRQGVISSVTFSPDGQRIVTGGEDGSAKLWDAQGRQEQLVVKGHAGRINSVAFAPGGGRLVTGGDDMTARIWNLASSPETVLFPESERLFLDMDLDADTQRALLMDDEGTLKLYDLPNAKEVLSLKSPNAVRAACFSLDGKRIAGMCDGGQLKVWDASNGRELHSLKLQYPPFFALSHDGQRIVVSGRDTIKVLDCATGAELRAFELKGSCRVILSPDDRQILAYGDGRTRVFDVVSGRQILTLGQEGDSGIVAAYSANGERVVTCTKDGSATIWNVATGKSLITLDAKSEGIGAASFSPDGNRVALAEFSGTTRVWDVVHGAGLLSLKGPQRVMPVVAFSRDGQRLMTGGQFNRNAVLRVASVASSLEAASWKEEEAAIEAALSSRRKQSLTNAIWDGMPIVNETGIREWLILGPVQSSTDKPALRLIDTQHMKDEALLMPKREENQLIGNKTLTWKAVSMDSLEFDLDSLVPNDTTNLIAYAVCYIMSDTERPGIQLLFGGSAATKIYLNGKEIYRSPLPKRLFSGEDAVSDIALRAGTNVLVVKMTNENGSWRNWVRVTDAQDMPIKGIRVTLDPDAAVRTQ